MVEFNIRITLDKLNRIHFYKKITSERYILQKSTFDIKNLLYLFKNYYLYDSYLNRIYVTMDMIYLLENAINKDEKLDSYIIKLNDFYK